MNLISLTPEQRLDALESAKQYMVRFIGEKPLPSQFQNLSMSKYPQWVTRMIAVFLGITAVASALPSLFRLFTAGRDYFVQGINEPFQGAIVGISTFMLAEFLVILSTISANVLYTGRARWLFAIPVVMGLSMAIVGNITVVQPHDLFSWLEALVPVFSVLFIALIGERLTLESIQSRHESTRAYEQAVATWQSDMSKIESHPRFAQAHADSIRQQIISVNARGTGAGARKAQMEAMTPNEWKQVVLGELNNDNWFTANHITPKSEPVEPKPHEVVIPNPFGQTARAVGKDNLEFIPMSRNGNGMSTNGHANGND